MDYVLLVLAIIMMIVGIAGCLLPVLPGPPLTYLGLVVLHFTRFATCQHKPVHHTGSGRHRGHRH